MYVLPLTLRKEPFDIMKTGEKKYEYRTKSRWILSRLTREDRGKLPITHIKFVNGYNYNSPYFVTKYCGYKIIDKVDKTYSNGLKVELDDPGNIIEIELGDIIERFS